MRYRGSLARQIGDAPADVRPMARQGTAAFERRPTPQAATQTQRNGTSRRGKPWRLLRAAAYGSHPMPIAGISVCRRYDASDRGEPARRDPGFRLDCTDPKFGADRTATPGGRRLDRPICTLAPPRQAAYWGAIARSSRRVRSSTPWNFHQNRRRNCRRKPRASRS